MNRVNWFRGTLAIAIAFMGVNALAQDTKKPADKPADAKATDPKPAPKSADKAAPAGDKGGAPDANAMMTAMMKDMQDKSAPGKEHEALKPLAGTFTCTSKFYMDPSQPPFESSGSMERKWMMGGRYLSEEFKGTMGGTVFEGFGITGYDKIQKQYHAYWIDNVGSGTWTQIGTADATGKSFTFTGENFDPMTMSKKKGKAVTEVVNNDKHVMKMYETGPDGKEFMTFEMSCTRK